jgi:hypothetical protein
MAFFVVLYYALNEQIISVVLEIKMFFRLEQGFLAFCDDLVEVGLPDCYQVVLDNLWLVTPVQEIVAPA